MTWDKCKGKWRVKYNRIAIGYYDDQLEAAKMYNNAATYALDTRCDGSKALLAINTLSCSYSTLNNIPGWTYQPPTKINPKLQALRGTAATCQQRPTTHLILFPNRCSHCARGIARHHACHRHHRCRAPSRSPCPCPASPSGCPPTSSPSAPGSHRAARLAHCGGIVGRV